MQNSTPLPMKNNRVLWIDGAKTIGIWLVVLGHMSIAEDIITPIFSFHMALFFFISGFLEKHTQIEDSFKNGFRGLLIPYLLFYIISFFWWFQVSLVRHPEIYGSVSFDSAIIKPLLGMLFGAGYSTEYSTMVNVPLWFLVGLFFVKILHSGIVTFCDGNVKKYLLINISIILLVFVTKKTDIDILFSFDSALLALPFFSVGYLSQRERFDTVSKLISRYVKSFLFKCISIIVALSVLLVLSEYNGRVDVNEYSYGRNLLIFYFNGFLGIFIIISLASFYRKQNKIITAISNGTIIIVAFHIYLSEILCKMIGMKGDGIIVNPFIALLVAVLTLVLMVVPIRIIEEYFPILIGKRRTKPLVQININKTNT
jgi:fucose 4-O-acetylase-like acetyltransferase